MLLDGYHGDVCLFLIGLCTYAMNLAAKTLLCLSCRLGWLIFCRLMVNGICFVFVYIVGAVLRDREGGEKLKFLSHFLYQNTAVP